MKTVNQNCKIKGKKVKLEGLSLVEVMGVLLVSKELVLLVRQT